MSPIKFKINPNVTYFQVDAIKEYSDMVTKLKRAGDGLGIHILDKELQ